MPARQQPEPIDAEPIRVDAPPLPGRPVLQQRWRDVVFLHWRVSNDRVRPLLPPGTRPDAFLPEGSRGHDGWVGLVAFRMEATRFPPLPPVPVLGSFLELNVRLYSVDDDGRRGVVFETLEASRLAPVLAANAAFGLPYRFARMRAARRGDELAYASQRVGGGPRTRIRVRVSDDAVSDDALAAFLTARWALHVGRFGRTRYRRNDHEPWPLFRAELVDLGDELLAHCGLPGLAERPPDSVLYSPGVTARFAGSR